MNFSFSLDMMDTLNRDQAARLAMDVWTIEKLAIATVKELMTYKGIGRIGARKIIAEATEILNERGLEDADRLAEEHYYQKAPLAKILTDWEEGGLPAKAVALSSAASLAVMKGIDELLALRLISKAQDVVNKRGLYQSRIATPRGGVRQTNAAFDEKWLSGEVIPPAMSIRVRRNFERARREYRANND
jgi:hypothetical protein